MISTLHAVRTPALAACSGLLLLLLMVLTAGGAEAQTLTSQSFTINVIPHSGPLCAPCQAVQESTSQLPPSLRLDLRLQQNGTAAADEETAICCVQNLTQFLTLVDQRMYHQAPRLQELATPARTPLPAMHVRLRDTWRETPSVSSAMQDLPRHEWTDSPSDFLYCRRGAVHSRFCDGISRGSAAASSQGIELPERGVYEVHSELAWHHDTSAHSQTGPYEFSLQVSRLTRGARSREVLGVHTEPRATCPQQTSPCAVARVQRTLRLAAEDQIFISASYKGLLIDDVAHSFLEIRKIL